MLPRLPYLAMALQVTLTFAGGYLWHVADTTPSTPSTHPEKQKYYYIASFTMLLISAYILITVHLKLAS